jgi:glutathione S-transferase
MSLELYFHPFASYCQKVLIALYENETPFEPRFVDLGDPVSRAAFLKVWSIGKFPVLVDGKRNRTIPESTIIIEYLAENYPGKVELVPGDADLALETRLRDRFFDLYVSDPMQKIVGDRLRPAGKKDPHGVEAAHAQLRTIYEILDGQMKSKAWACGDAFTMADCAAAPALFYANLVEPFGSYPNVAAYDQRLKARPSFARIIREAEPFFKSFPQ